MMGAWFAGAEASVEVSPEARASFERAFGLSPHEQLRVESSLVPLDLRVWSELEVTDTMACPPGVYETEADAAQW